LRIRYLFEQILAFLDVEGSLGVVLLELYLVHLVVVLRVFYLEMRHLYQVRDLFEFVKSVVWVVHHYSVEDLSEMSVEIQLNSTPAVSRLFQLLLYALQSVQVHAHI
jgi:hypothetical protein